MVKVAVVGGSSGFGRTFVRVFLNTPNPHKLIILSRHPNEELQQRDVNVHAVDYRSHTELVKALGGVHTILSFLNCSFGDFLETQTNLVNAAKEAEVKRFAPSELLGINNQGIDMYANKTRSWEMVKSSGLEYTRFCCGLFMGILGIGTPKPPSPGSEYATGELEALAGVRPYDFILNMKAGTADLPGDGTTRFCITDTNDVARYILASLNLDSWPEISGMRGDVKSFKEIIAIAERVQGRKFLSKETTKAGLQNQIENTPATSFYNQVRMRLVEDEWALVPDTLNSLIPAIRPVTVEEYVEKWWGGVTDLPAPSKTD